MPLTQEESQKLIVATAGNIGCPLTVTDRLAAFAEGYKAGILAVAPHVSLDNPEAFEGPKSSGAVAPPEPELDVSEQNAPTEKTAAAPRKKRAAKGGKGKP